MRDERPRTPAGPFMHSVAERLLTSTGNSSLRGNTDRDGLPRTSRKAGQPAPAVAPGPEAAPSCVAPHAAPSALRFLRRPVNEFPEVPDTHESTDIRKTAVVAGVSVGVSKCSSWN